MKLRPLLTRCSTVCFGLLCWPIAALAHPGHEHGAPLDGALPLLLAAALGLATAMVVARKNHRAAANDGQPN